MLESVEKCLEKISKKDEEINLNSHYSEKGSKVYDTYYGNMEGRYWIKNKQKILDNIINTNTNNIMCLACGSGRTLKYISKNYEVNDLYGLDYSNTMTKLAKERTDENIQIIKGSFKDLDFIDKKFDLVYMFGNPINHYKYDVMKDILPEVSKILNGKFVYDFIKHEGWDMEPNLHLGTAQTKRFLIPRASCNHNNRKIDDYYRDNTDMVYQIRDKYENNTNIVNIKNIELYSHPKEKHYECLDKYNYKITKEKDHDGRKIIYCSNK